MTATATLWTPAPPDSHWGDARLMAVDLCNAIPEARYALYGNLAATYNDLAKARGIGSSTHTARTFGIYVDDHHLHPGPKPNYWQWTVAWHRMRDVDGLARGWGINKIHDPDDQANVLFREEGGHLFKGFGGVGWMPNAQKRDEIDMRAAVRRGEIVIP